MYRHGNIDMETGEIDFSLVRNIIMGPSQDKETGEFNYISDDSFAKFQQPKFKIPKKYLLSPEDEITPIKKAPAPEVPEDSENTCPFSKMASKCHLKEVKQLLFNL